MNTNPTQQGKDDVVMFQQSLKYLIPGLIFGPIYLIVGFFRMQEVWPFMIFGFIFLLSSVLGLIPGCFYLRLDSEGFTEKRFLSKRAVKWRDIEHLRLGKQMRGLFGICYDYSPSSNIRLLFPIFRWIYSGSHGFVLNQYKVSHQELITQFNDFWANANHKASRS